MNLKKVLDKIKAKSEYRKSVEIMGVNFDLCLLSIDEEIRANTTDPDIGESEGMALFGNLKKNVLSYSLRKIDEEEIPDIVEEAGDKGTDKKSRAVYLKGVLKDWNSQLIDSLFQAYIDLKEEAEESVKKSIKYQWYKEPEKRQAELIKKMEGMGAKGTGEGGEKGEGTAATGAEDVKKSPEDTELKEVRVSG